MFAFNGFPKTLGLEVSGEVLEIGDNITNVKVGDKVLAQLGVPKYTSAEQLGGASNYSKLHTSMYTKVNDDYDMRENAAIPLTGLTSYQMLVHTMDVKNIKKILVLGGPTACGMISFPILKHFNVEEVWTTTSTRNEEYIKTLNVNYVNYNNKDWSEELKGKDFDVVYDTVGVKGD